MNRRRYLERIGATAALGIAGLSGCSAPGGGAAETPAATGTSGGTATGADGGATSPAGADTPTNAQDDTQTATAEGTATATAGQQVPDEIAMRTASGEYVFDPIGLYVEPGETITWVNESGSHSTTAYTRENPLSDVNRIPNEAEGWNSDIISEEGAEFTHTFEVPGTYDFYCIPHKSLAMVARLVVGEPGGIEGDPPDGPVPSEQRIVDQGAVTQDEFNP